MGGNLTPGPFPRGRGGDSPRDEPWCYASRLDIAETPPLSRGKGPGVRACLQEQILHDRGKGDHRFVVRRPLLIPCRHPPPSFQPVHTPLHHVALPVQHRIEPIAHPLVPPLRVIARIPHRRACARIAPLPYPLSPTTQAGDGAACPVPAASPLPRSSVRARPDTPAAAPPSPPMPSAVHPAHSADAASSPSRRDCVLTPRHRPLFCPRRVLMSPDVRAIHEMPAQSSRPSPSAYRCNSAKILIHIPCACQRVKREYAVFPFRIVRADRATARRCAESTRCH